MCVSPISGVHQPILLGRFIQTNNQRPVPFGQRMDFGRWPELVEAGEQFLDLGLQGLEQVLTQRYPFCDRDSRPALGSILPVKLDLA